MIWFHCHKWQKDRIFDIKGWDPVITMCSPAQSKYFDSSWFPDYSNVICSCSSSPVCSLVNFKALTCTYLLFCDSIIITVSFYPEKLNQWWRPDRSCVCIDEFIVRHLYLSYFFNATMRCQFRLSIPLTFPEILPIAMIYEDVPYIHS